MSTPPRIAVRDARRAVTAAFVLHGLVFSSWLPHIPSIKDDLGLSAGGLGLLLLAPPAGAILAMPVTGAACARWGSGPVTRATIGGYGASLFLIGLAAGNVWTLAAALLWAGMVVGASDVAMNAQAATVERAAGKPIMGSFHAVWSLSAAAGAAVGGWVAEHRDLLGGDLALPAQLLGLGVLGLGVFRYWAMRFIADPAPSGADRAARWRFEPGLILLSIVAFAGLLAEGATADWSAVFLSENENASAMVAGWGYAAFSVAMFTGRLLGDRLVGRFGRARSVATAALTGGGGLAIGLAAAELAPPGAAGQVTVIAGLCVLGLGIAVIVPVVFSAAADGPGIATVSTGGYTGWLLGPAIIGGLGEWWGLSVAIWAVPALAVLAGVVAPFGIRVLRQSSERTKPSAA